MKKRLRSTASKKGRTPAARFSGATALTWRERNWPAILIVLGFGLLIMTAAMSWTP